MTKCRYDTNSDAIEYIKVHLCVKVTNNFKILQNRELNHICSMLHLSPISNLATMARQRIIVIV